MRHKTVLKVESDTYIFVRRAVEQKSRKPKKEALESDGHLLDNEQPQEESAESKRRRKIIFKKLFFYNSRRMLDILKFKPGESERKKLKALP